MMRERVERILQDLLEQGLIEGYEIPPDPKEELKIFVAKSSKELERRLQQKLKDIPFRIEEIGPLEAL